MKYLPTEYGEEYYSEVAQKYPGVSQGSIMRVFERLHRPCQRTYHRGISFKATSYGSQPGVQRIGRDMGRGS